MKIGIISDTHDNLNKTEKAVEFFKSQNTEKVIHCGDIISPFTAKLFDSKFEFHCVKGNNDGEWNLKKAINKFGKFHDNLAELNIQGKNIAVYHGTEKAIVEALTKKEYDYVLRGHTHQKKIEEHDGTIELNPGGIKLPGQEQEFHVATINLDNNEIEFHRIK